jgi:hypothetical protein
LSAQLGAVTKLLLFVIAASALANAAVSSQSQPPLLIDSQPAPTPTTSLDAQ